MTPSTSHATPIADRSARVRTNPALSDPNSLPWDVAATVRRQYGPDVDVVVSQTVGTLISSVPLRQLTSSVSSQVELAIQLHTWNSRIHKLRGVAVSSAILLHEPNDISYQWRDQLRQLQNWRGDPEAGEAYAIFPTTLALAHLMATQAQRILDALNLSWRTLVYPTPEAGIQLEWTIRDDHVRHFEIGITDSNVDRFEVFATLETLDGRVAKVLYDVDDASISEALGAFSAFVRRIGQMPQT